MNRIKKIILSLGALVLVGQGCVSINFGGNKAPDGGIWKTSDKGEIWAQKSAVATVPPATRSVSNINTNSMAQDPQDPQAIYLATNENGLVYTYDGGESWAQSPKLSVGKVNVVVVDPRYKCTILVAQTNRVLRSTDCSRTFGVAYFDARSNVIVTTIIANSRKPGEVFAGTSVGDLLKSTDSGVTWTVLKVFPSQVQKVVLDPFAATNAYVATRSSGVWKSQDEGKTWKDLSAGTREFSGSNEVSHLVADETSTDSFFSVSRFGILHTRDGGLTWEKVNLLTPPGSTQISSFALNSKNPNEMYYGTATTFYKTSDGGAHWATKRLPSSRVATALLLDYSNSSVLYMGVTRAQK